MTDDVPDFDSLSEADKQAVAARLLAIQNSNWKPFWCPDAQCSGDPHPLLDENGWEQWVEETAVAGPNGEPVSADVYDDEDGNPLGRMVLDPRWAHNHARVDQRLPSWLKPWILFIMSGRGAGKTRTGVEFVTLSARKGLNGAILGRRGTELVNTHVAEIMAHAHPDFMPIHWSSKDILEWPEVTLPDGTKTKPITYLFSAEKPENIRSVNLSYAWVDEAAFMDEIETAWMNLKLATRISTPGNPIHILITSTPTATPWVMEMEDDVDVEVRRVSTYANVANLDEGFIADLRKKYEGTRMGRQELHGEVLRDVEGSLWNDDMFKHYKIEDAQTFDDYVDSLDMRVLAIDPAGSKSKRSDETGIIGSGAHHYDEDGNRLSISQFSVLVRATLKGTPTEWARQAFKAARLIKANVIVAEKNFGGDMVKQVLTDFAAKFPEEARDHEGEPFRIEVRHAVLGKETRAEGVVGRYEQGRVTHVPNGTIFGDLSALEKQQVTWVPKSRGGRMPSPNDIDALVWSIRELDTAVKHETTSASSREVMKKMKRRGGGGPLGRAS